MNDLKITVQYQGQSFEFNYGSQVYIFHAGVYKDMDTKYSMDILLQYVSFVFNCYLSDSNRTPLGSLADFVADEWEEVKDMGRYELLDKFYAECDY